MADRIRKAYRATMPNTCTFDAPYDEIVFAPTASKARWLIVSRLQDCGWFETDTGKAFAAVRVHRAPRYDTVLPPEHPVVADLTWQEKRALIHAYGGTGANAGYRDHYCTHAGNPTLVRLVERGLMTGPVHGNPELWGEDTAFFYLNWMGLRVALSLQPTYPEG
ncbi:hypothetical protein [Zavarzinia sp.]|uniref:hypothetical protein n=1 Tax=Zavarzinia sp. TaxID=2027920 RepID=UPI003BB671B3